MLRDETNEKHETFLDTLFSIQAAIGDIDEFLQTKARESADLDWASLLAPLAEFSANLDKAIDCFTDAPSVDINDDIYTAVSEVLKAHFGQSRSFVLRLDLLPITVH